VIQEDFPLINNIRALPDDWIIAPSFGPFNLELIIVSENYFLCISSSPTSNGDPRYPADHSVVAGGTVVDSDFMST
jgi:hypothetical protein